jgi:hypothetical protein
VFGTGGAELGEFVALGVGLPFGPFGPLGAGAQVGAQFLWLAGRIGARLAQHPAGVGANPLGLGLGRLRGGLGKRDVLTASTGPVAVRRGPRPGRI